MEEQTAIRQPPSLAWGLDVSVPDITTPEEIEAFRRNSVGSLGIRQVGLEFVLDTRPDALKRHRVWGDRLRVQRTVPSGNGLGMLITYSLLGFDEGLQYCLSGISRSYTRAQMLDVFALAFRYVGPRGMAAIADAAKDRVWTDPPSPPVWPEGWAADPEAFRSGVDFRAPGVTADDVRKIEAWYERYLGEVPKHIRFLGKYRPELLKAYRDRYENTLRVLPKQIEPYVQIHLAVQRGQKSVIREGVLLARGFGMSKMYVLEAISWGTFYGGTEALDLAYDAADDLLENWPET